LSLGAIQVSIKDVHSQGEGRLSTADKEGGVSSGVDVQSLFGKIKG